MTVGLDRDTEESPICPECRDHKCHNCDTTAWSDLNDRPTYCRCWVNNHGRGVRRGPTAARPDADQTHDRR